MKDWIQLLRIKHWVKNTFIFFPLIFSGSFFDKVLLKANLLTFFGFCFISSGVYVLNDFLDLKKDRLHPKKANRPLLKGKINKPVIFTLIGVLPILGLIICNNVGIAVLFAAVIYLILNIVYNFGTKQIVLLDVIFIAFGFHVRIWAGSAATEVLPSVWLQMCVFLLALFLGFTKRRYEISSLKDKAAEHRSVLAHYTSYLLDQIIIICSTLAIVFYGLYTISAEVVDRLGNQNMVYSVTFVIYGIFRYLYLIHVKKMGNDPAEILFSDMPLLACILLWIAYIGGVIYFA